MFKPIKFLIKQLFLFLGYEVKSMRGGGLKGKPSIIQYKSITIVNNIPWASEPPPSGLDAIYVDMPDFVFNINLELCCNHLYYTFSKAGWHFFTATIMEYQRNNQLTYDNSLLKAYYEKFQPKTLCEAYFENRSDIFPLNQLSPYVYLKPWFPSANLISGSTHGGNQNFGPVSKIKGIKEFDRIISLYKSLKQNGYNPEIYDNYIEGYFLKSKNSYRFMVIDGVHRASVMAALGYSDILVKFHPKTPRVINVNDIDDWPLVKYRYLNKEVARMIFDRYFDEMGVNKAKNIGMI